MAAYDIDATLQLVFSVFQPSRGGATYKSSVQVIHSIRLVVNRELCFDADDIWLKCMEVLSDVPVVWVKNWEVDPLDVADSTNGTLSSLNVDYRKNDAYLHNVMDYFKIPVEKFFR